MIAPSHRLVRDGMRCVLHLDARELALLELSALGPLVIAHCAAGRGTVTGPTGRATLRTLHPQGEWIAPVALSKAFSARSAAA